MEEPFRIFIASPSDTSNERSLIRDIVHSCSDINKLKNLPTFITVGYEEVAGSIGRTQTVINEELQKCDYGIIMFKHDWGTNTGELQPGMKQLYTSGTEEELFTCLLAVQNSEEKMKDILVVFIPSTDRDPRISALQKQIREKHCLLYESPKSEADFRQVIQRKVQCWASEAHPHKRAKSIRLVPSSDIDILRVDYSLREGVKLEKQGEIKKAHELLEYAANNGGVKGKLAFGKFLSHQGWLDESLDWNQRALRDIDAQNVDGNLLRAEAHMAIGHVLRRQNQPGEAIIEQQSALQCLGEPNSRDDSLKKAEIHDALGHAHHDNEQYPEALKHFQISLSIRKKAKDDGKVLQSYINIAREYMNSNKLDDAKSALAHADNIVDDKTDFRLQANYYALRAKLGQRLELDPEIVLSDAKRSLTYNEKTGDQNGKAVSHNILAQVYIQLDELDKARENAEKCLIIDKKSRNLNGKLTAHHLLAEIAKAEQNWELAVSEYDKELEYLEDQPRNNVRKAWTLLFKAQSLHQLGENASALQNAEHALRLMPDNSEEFNTIYVALRKDIQN